MVPAVIRHRFSHLLMGLMLFMALFISTSLVASAHTSNATADTAPCGASSYVCIAPNVQGFCNGAQSYTDTSHDGHPIGWTYTYGTHHCLTVSWDLAAAPLSPPCAVFVASVYIPWGHATATVNYRIGDHAGNPSSLSQIIDQSSYGNGAGEFVQLTPKVSRNEVVWFEDDGNPGGDYHAAQIAWGTDESYSLKLDCVTP